LKQSKIEGHPDLIRDMNTNAILNTNKSGYEEYLTIALAKQKEQNKVEDLERNLDTIKEEINQVKSLLQELLNATK
jgi:predicted transcriptional regulator